MTERRILGELDFDYGVGDPAEDDGWFGRAQVEAAEPVTAPEFDDAPTDYPRYPAQYDPEDPDPEVIEAEETPWAAMLAPRTGRHRAAPVRSWEAKLVNSGAWDFKVSVAVPWYRSKRVLTAGAAVAVLALALTGVLLLTRGAGSEDAAPVPPTNPTTAGPAPASRAPALSSAVEPPPPPLPPPPPPSAEQITTPPTGGYAPPRRSAPSQSETPEIGVTRTPVTRVPFSATPPPPRAPDRNSATPGDAPRGGWGRW